MRKLTTSAVQTRVVYLPRTPAGRALLRETLITINDPETRAYVANLFDWDGGAVELAALDLDRREIG